MAIDTGLELFVVLAMGHFLGDFGLQSDRMAVEKCAGRDATLPWQWWLLAHAGIHGLLVAVITSLPWLGLAEWCLHALVDTGKCRGFYGVGVDQALHLFCKLIWTALAVRLLALVAV